MFFNWQRNSKIDEIIQRKKLKDIYNPIENQKYYDKTSFS